MIDEIYSDYSNHLLRGQRAACLDIVKTLIDQGVEIKTLYLELFQRTLYEVGDLWERNLISVATEHLATSITESAMGLVQPLIFSKARCGRKAVVSCVANEYHQVGGKMVADVFELHGWDGYFLGANTPLADLLSMIEDKRPDVVCLSLSVYFNMPNLMASIEAIWRQYPQLDILVGGQAFQWGGKDLPEKYPTVKVLYSLDHLESYIVDGKCHEM